MPQSFQSSRIRELSTLAVAVPPRTSNPPSADLLLDRLTARGITSSVLVTETDAAAHAAVAASLAFTLSPSIEATPVGTYRRPATEFPLRVRVIGARDHPDVARLESVLWRISR